MDGSGASRHLSQNPTTVVALETADSALVADGHGPIRTGRAVRTRRPAAKAGRPHCCRSGCGRAEPCAARGGGIGRFPCRIALAHRAALARNARLPTEPFFKQFQILTTMAKDHVLPRYLLWAAVCVCMLLGRSVLKNDDEAQTERIGLINTDFPAGEGSHDAPIYKPMNEVSQNEAQNPKASVTSVLPVFDSLREIYFTEIGVKEATGNNDGSRIGEYLGYCGLPEGYAWCAAFVSWCHGQAGYGEPRNAWAAALFPSSRTIWHTGDRWLATDNQQMPRAGDVFGIYYTTLRRIAHAGFVDGWDGKHCITVEGNTGPDGIVDTRSDPGNPIRAGPIDGVYRKRRPIRTIHAVARWTE